MQRQHELRALDAPPNYVEHSKRHLYWRLTDMVAHHGGITLTILNDVRYQMCKETLII